MSLRITVLPASTQAGKETIRVLLEDSRHTLVNGIYRDTTKAPSEFVKHPRFRASQGDLSGKSELDFSNTDAVFYIPPPTYDGTDSATFARHNATKVKTAIRKASHVKRLLVFSATGAQYDKGIGILIQNHVTDQVLADCVNEVIIAKGSWFMENWASAFETLKADPPYFESFLTPADHKIAMISLVDVGKICAQKLLGAGQSLSSSPQVLNLQGPRNYSAGDVQAVLETLTGKSINLVDIKPNGLFDYYCKFVPAASAQELVEMTVAMLPGGLIAADMDKAEDVVRGEMGLFESLRKVMSGETTKVASGAF